MRSSGGVGDTVRWLVEVSDEVRCLGEIGDTVRWLGEVGDTVRWLGGERLVWRSFIGWTKLVRFVRSLGGEIWFGLFVGGKV